ncbi:MAG: PD40 domain-containing protein, partial [Chitinophagaceae bacterium]|nr:PD40 domain-containing protein [Anaerolineae bacterium]
YPMASPDGQRIAFQSNRDGDFDLYLIGIDGRDLQRLTNNEVIDRLPAWSPDGNWIVYASDTRGDGNYDIYRMRVDGEGTVGEVDLLVSNGQRNSRANYSGDGRYITYTTGNKDDANTWEIAVMEVETGEIRNLTDNDVRDYSPTFSPDGETVLFVTDGEGRAAIATSPFSGGDARVIYDGSGYEWGVSYSPDGQYVLFNSELDGASTIYLMRADGTEVSAVPTLGGYYPSWVR